MKNRSTLRDIIVKVLYQTYIFESSNTKYNISDLIKEFDALDEKFVIDSVSIIKQNESTINSIANKHLNNWTIDRLSKVDRAILSLGIYEMLYTDTPKIVCINEAVELAKVYSDDRVGKMINGCLDKYFHEEQMKVKQWYEKLSVSRLLSRVLRPPRTSDLRRKTGTRGTGTGLRRRPSASGSHRLPRASTRRETRRSSARGGTCRRCPSSSSDSASSRPPCSRAAAAAANAACPRRRTARGSRSRP